VNLIRVGRLLFVVSLLAAGVAGAQPAAPASSAPPPSRITDLAPTVVLISLDGMRHDYPEKRRMPNLERLIAGGVRATLVPVFPTETFPNHYTQVTGLYAEHHGIVRNTIHDPATGKEFRMGDQASVVESMWWGGEPIWVTAIKQGQRASACFWPGSEAEIAGHRPTHYLTFDNTLGADERIACVLDGLARPAAERPTFFTLYFSDLDSVGHVYGPDSPEILATLDRMDAALGRLIAGLEALGVFDRVNLLIVADHGMTATPIDKVIYLDDLLDPGDAHVVAGGPLLSVRSRSGRDEAIYQALAGAKGPFRVFRREEVPLRLGYRGHPRITPIVALADEGHTFRTRAFVEARRATWNQGGHGFDPAFESMHALFAGHGPAFRRGVRAEPFEAVHLYELMCRMLGLTPAPNDGSLEEVHGLLR
jgi:predicted AlkP superfamily pyrophosphatase or phosphodiesterase